MNSGNGENTNPIGALRGTRMGRVVKTPEEVMAEMAEIASGGDKEAKLAEIPLSGDGIPKKKSSKGVLISEPLVLTPSQRLEDRFNYSGFEVVDTNVRFKKLIVPGGDWKTVTEGSEYGSGVGDHINWCELSQGSLAIAGNNFVKGNGVPHQEGFMPLRAYYWFLRAGHLEQRYRNGPAACLEAAKFVKRHLIISSDDWPIHFAETFHLNKLHTTDYNRLEIMIHGWWGHPFNQKREVLIRKDLPNRLFLSDKPHYDDIAPITYALFDDPKPLLVEKVFQWAFQTDAPVSLLLPPVDALLSVFDINRKTGTISLYGDPRSRLGAKSLRADAADYRKVTP